MKFGTFFDLFERKFAFVINVKKLNLINYF